jgi:hypothetical protein
MQIVNNKKTSKSIDGLNTDIMQQISNKGYDSVMSGIFNENEDQVDAAIFNFLKNLYDTLGEDFAATQFDSLVDMFAKDEHFKSYTYELIYTDKSPIEPMLKEHPRFHAFMSWYF